MDKRLAMLIAVVMAAIAAALIYGYTGKVKKDAYQGLDRIKVLVASQEIKAGDKLNAHNVAFDEYPTKYVGNRAIDPQQAYDVLGATVLNNIQSTQPIFWSDLQPQTLGQHYGLADIIEKGMRAFTIPVTDTAGMAGMLRPLQRIDLIFTFDINQFSPKSGSTGSTELPPAYDPANLDQMRQHYIRSYMNDQGGGAQGKRSAVLFENMLIMAVGNQAPAQGIVPDLSAPTGKGASLDGSDQTPAGYNSITLAVTPEQAKILTFCMGEGIMNIMLRRTGDETLVNDDEMVTYSTVLQTIKDKGKPKNPITTKTP
ncbi:MAG: Flp pilus assembly protein CpaB [Spartobacteria bacterium]|nr:Flp pilus assembly protein CpaB [Spartobacteria bacterium]